MSVSCPSCQAAVPGAILKIEADAEMGRKIAQAQVAAEAELVKSRTEAAAAKSGAEAIAAELVKSREMIASAQKAVRVAQVQATGLAPETLPILELVYGQLPEKDRPEFSAALAANGALRTHPLVLPYFAAPVQPAPAAPVAAPVASQPPAPGQQLAAPDLAALVQQKVTDVLAQFNIQPAAPRVNGLPNVAAGQPPATTVKLTAEQLQAQIAHAKKTKTTEDFRKYLADAKAEYMPDSAA